MELPAPVAFFDGECSVCDRTVRWLLDHDGNGELCFASLQGETAARLRTARPDFPRDLATMVLAEPLGDGTVRLQVESSGLVRALQLVGAPRRAVLLRAVPRPIRDVLYRLVAANRYRIFGRKDVCDLPSPADRSRLLP